MKYKDYLKTDYWNTVRNAVKAKAGWKCQVCNSPHDLNAHHRSYDHRGDELNHLDDLICLCRRCHGVFHSKLEVESSKDKVSTHKKQPQVHKCEVLIDVDAINRDMPDGDIIILTEDFIRKCRTSVFGLTNATIRALNPPNLCSGWPKRLIGTKITRDEYRKALEGRYLYRTGRLNIPHEVT